MLDSADYVVYSAKGKMVESGHALFINMNEHKQGAYFIRYNGKNVAYERGKH